MEQRRSLYGMKCKGCGHIYIHLEALTQYEPSSGNCPKCGRRTVPIGPDNEEFSRQYKMEHHLGVT